MKTSRLAVGAPTEVPLSALIVDEADIAAMSATIRTPSGQEEPCVLKRLENGQLGQCCFAYVLLVNCFVITWVNV